VKHVIIGNGPAGVIAAETLRRASRDDSIVMLGDEPEPPYSRMALPYLLAGRIDEAGTHLRKSPRHFDDLRIDVRRATARSVDAGKRTVTLESGEALAYDRLLVATGSVTRKLGVPGESLPGVLPCWTLAHARLILRRAQPGASVLLVGAGFIGCIVLEALAARGVKLTVVEMGPRMVPRMMTEGAGDMIRQWCERKGIRVHLQTRVEAIEAGGNSLRAKLSGAETVACELVITAAGVSPNISCLAGSGIATEQGMLVDHRMRASDDGVFGAGDVTQAPEFGSGKRVVNAIQPVAAEQARIAALNMAGRNVKTPGMMAMNVLDTAGLIASSFGQWQGVPGEQGGSSVELRDDAAFRYLRLEFHEDVLVGATSLGHTDHVGVIRGLIQGRVRLGEWRERLLKNPLRLPDAYVACAQQAV
jgi:NADPH-dependent 2,4-dienoyl-CoA reductase/sulfur reductase-like enzyme